MLLLFLSFRQFLLHTEFEGQLLYRPSSLLVLLHHQIAIDCLIWSLDDRLRGAIAPTLNTTLLTQLDLVACQSDERQSLLTESRLCKPTKSAAVANRLAARATRLWCARQYKRELTLRASG